MNDTSIGTEPWLAPQNVFENDILRALVNTLDASSGRDTSHYLAATEFGFTIPDTALVTRVIAAIHRGSTLPGGVRDESVRLIKDGIVQGRDRATAAPWSENEEIAHYDDGLWGLDLSPTDVNASTFGIAIAARDDSVPERGSPHLYWIELAVCYALPSETATQSAPPASLATEITTTVALTFGGMALLRIRRLRRL